MTRLAATRSPIAEERGEWLPVMTDGTAIRDLLWDFGMNACVSPTSLRIVVAVVWISVTSGCSANSEQVGGQQKSDAPIRKKTKEPKVVDLSAAATLLEKLSGKKVRKYSHYDFGRLKDQTAISIVVPEKEGRPLVEKLRSQLGEGLIVFMGTSRWLGDEQHEGGVEVVVGKGEDQFAILNIARSDAVNYDMGTDDLIKKLRQYDKDYGIQIFHAETDTIEFTLNSLPKDTMAFARALYKFCPDIVDQGVGSVDKLEDSIRKYQQVYLWWD